MSPPILHTWKAPSDDPGQSTKKICTEQEPFLWPFYGNVGCSHNKH